jgi:phosphatidylglycerol lysyltransferase
MVLVLVTLLVFFFRYFQARSDPPSIRRGYLAFIMGLGVVTFYTFGGFLALYTEFRPLVDRFGIDGVLLRLLTNAHLHMEAGTQALFFERALPMLCMSAVVYGMVQILHPVTVALLANEKERQAVSGLASSYGRNSISYFALGEDKSYFFSTTGKAVISYVLKRNVAVVAGDPIGPEEEILPTIKQFVEFCHQQDWTLVFWQARNDLVDLYRSVGFHLLKIGEDAVIDVRAFTLKGGAMANVRSSAKRAEKDGLRVVFYRGQIENAEQLFQMQMISRTWLANKGGTEMSFSMGHFDVRGDEKQLSALAVDNTNRVHAFVTFVPIYGRNGWGLDLMRRGEQSAPGTMELLLARSIEYLKSCGADMVSLGLAPMSNVNNDDETFLNSSIDFLTHRFGNLSSSQSLFKFKRKFQPIWESRYLVFSHRLTLPQIGWALYAAHQQEASCLSVLRTSLRDWQANRQKAQTRSEELAGAARSPVTGALSL